VVLSMKQAGVARVAKFGHPRAMLPGSRRVALVPTEGFVCAQCKHGRHCACVSLRCACPRCAPVGLRVALRR
jgi:hypothetical protein